MPREAHGTAFYGGARNLQDTLNANVVDSMFTKAFIMKRFNECSVHNIHYSFNVITYLSKARREPRTWGCRLIHGFVVDLPSPGQNSRDVRYPRTFFKKYTMQDYPTRQSA